MSTDSHSTGTPPDHFPATSNGGVSNMIDFVARQRLRQLESEHQSEQHRQHLHRLAAVPRRYAGCSLSDYRVEHGGQQQHAWELANAIAQRPLLPGSKVHGLNLLLAGHSGTGKTHIASAVLNAWLQAGAGGHFTSHAGMLRSIKDSYAQPDVSEHQAIARYIHAPLLIIDELGRTSQNDWAQQLLFDILDKRYADMTSTIITSNLDPEQAQELIGKAMQRRFAASGGIVHCDWPAY